MDFLSGSSGSPDLVDFLHATVLSSKGLLSLVVSIVVIMLVTEAYRANFPKIQGIPEVPGALPFVGHLHKLGGRSGENDATVFSQWSKQLQSSVFQCVLGNQRTVVVEDWATMKHLWVSQSNALIDRPHQPGFVDKLGIDLTGSCMTDQVRKCRAAGMRALGKPNWHKYYHLLEPSSGKFIRDMYRTSTGGSTPVDTYAYLRQIVFDLGLSLTYGARFGEVDDDFMMTFIKSINGISSVRSSTKIYRHFVPLLRIVPESTNQTIAAERVRRKHRDVLYNRYMDRVRAGETVDCIVAALHEDKLTEEEVHGTCLSLLQAAPDTVASGTYMAIAWLASPEGCATQAIAYQAILDAYGGDRTRAWQMAFREEKVPLITSIYKETLRFFTLAPYATPRRTVADVTLPNGIVLPKGITLIMNAQAVDHDVTHFGNDAWQFRPDRYLDPAKTENAGLPHVAFGAGSRICPAVNISNRIIYALVTRLLLAFEMDNSTDPARMPVMDAIRFSDVANALVAHPRFYDCHFKVRDAAWLDATLAAEESVTTA
ncbi:hypothetical protein SEUCBS140593_002510 [Sporothrix eucalyptigena]|uniref:Cytochrome P450 n=1 Tax=Sporothrix eucalyptigena TaxID=1812306 RepID=A0ABP0B723_9PEZI